VKQYYDRRAAEYDEWYAGTGLHARRERPGWHEEVAALCAVVAALPPARTLDVACGTGFLTRHLRGDVTALDQSEAMLAIARDRVPAARVVRGDGLALPFADREFERVFTGHFYGHLLEGDRERFLAEARRVAGELVVTDSALRDDVEPEEWQERKLNDGSRHEVYKRFFTGDGLAAELGGAEVLHEGRWFVVVRQSERTKRPITGSGS
jgi:ubiquinone/menaquinone biosynthesis C-methylase UbiE